MRSPNFDGEPDPPASDDDQTTQQEPAPAPDEPVDRLSFGVTDNGRRRISGELGLDDGRLIEAAPTERRDALNTDGNETVT